MPGARSVSTVVATQMAAEDQGHDDEPERHEEQVHGDGVAAAGAAVGDVGADHDARADQPRPEGQGRRPGEGDRAGADLQRDDGGGQAEEERGDHAEHGAQEVERVQLGDGVGVQDVEGAVVDPLERQQGRHDQQADREHQRQGHVEASDAAVVAGGQPVGQPVLGEPSSTGRRRGGVLVGGARRGRRLRSGVLHGHAAGDITQADRRDFEILFTSRFSPACRRRGRRRAGSRR